MSFWKRLYRPVFRQACRKMIMGRLQGEECDSTRHRWTTAEVDELLRGCWHRVDELLPVANLDELPTVGNRHNVFLAVVTVGLFQTLLHRGFSRGYARLLVGDVGWEVYRRMLLLASLPFRITTKNASKRLNRTLRALLIFPFSAPGNPGYEVRVWQEEGDTFTHWTHCPPLAFVRALIEQNGDQGELEAFSQSWCRYDWDGADIIASDGRRGHYSRTQTMSLGDPVCDMCWRGFSLNALQREKPN